MFKAENTCVSSKTLTTAKKSLLKLESRDYGTRAPYNILLSTDHQPFLAVALCKFLPSQPLACAGPLSLTLTWASESATLWSPEWNPSWARQ